MNKLLSGLLVTALAFAAFTFVWPEYQQRQARHYYHHVISSANRYKLSVISCFHRTGDLAQCNNDQNGIPGPKVKHQGVQLASVSAGQIVVTPQKTHGISAQDTYILTPEINSDGHLYWQISGPALQKGLVS